MEEKYETYFNAPDSKINVDGSWDKHFSGEGRMSDRFAYSVGHLYGKVLEVGAGDGYFAFLASQQTAVEKVIALEIQDKAIERLKFNLQSVPYASGRIQVVRSCIETYDPSARFDSIHCGHTLEHVLDFEKSMDMIEELAKDVVVISVPINGGLSKQHLREFKDVDKFRKIVSAYFDEIEYKEFKKGAKRSTLVIVSRKKK